MDVTYASPFSLQQDANGSGSFTYLETRLRSRIMLTPQGSVRIYWHSGNDWILKYDALLNSCDIYGVCGPFGFCVPPKCECLKGFVPKYIKEWKRGNWTGGCVRRTELLCQGKSTGKDVNVFHSIANIKPPDSYELASAENPILSAEDCHQICLHNCSCLAFSFINGIGCLVWSQQLIDVVQFPAGGELLSIRLARSELGGNNRKITVAASVVSLFLFVLLGSAAYGFWRYIMKHKVSVDLLDKYVADSCQPSEVERCVQIGLICVQHQPADRPNTLELLSMLTTTSDLPSPKQPTFVVHTRDEESLSKGLITVNEMTQTVILGR